jgi:hypothetical protein
MVGRIKRALRKYHLLERTPKQTEAEKITAHELLQIRHGNSFVDGIEMITATLGNHESFCGKYVCCSHMHFVQRTHKNGRAFLNKPATAMATVHFNNRTRNCSQYLTCLW